MSNRFVNPPTLSKPPANGYSHVVVVSGGRTAYISGQLGLNSSGQLLEGFEAQCAQAFENLSLALEAVSMTLEHLVKINLYLTDMTHLAAMRKVRDLFLSGENRPSSTLVGVAALALAGALFEVDAVAVALE